MFTFLKKYSPLFLIVFLLILFASLWLFPSATPTLGIAFLLFSLTIAISPIFEKHKSAYLKGEMTRQLMRRKIVKDVLLLVSTILLVMFLGGIAVSSTHFIYQ